MMDDMYSDRITVVDNSGKRYENLPAVVGVEGITTKDANVHIESGYLIERELPNGKIETFKVLNAHLYRGFGGTIQDFYEITYEREGARSQRSSPRTINVDIRGSAQSHVNINSEDHSISVSYGNAASIFEEIRDLLREAVEDSTELESLLEKVDAMEGSKEAGGFKQAYDDFIASSANHITVLLPILPALSSLLAQ